MQIQVMNDSDLVEELKKRVNANEAMPMLYQPGMSQGGQLSPPLNATAPVDSLGQTQNVQVLLQDFSACT